MPRLGDFFLAISVVIRNCEIQLQILNELPFWNYSSSSYFLWLWGGKRKFVLDKLKPLMVTKYYSTSSTESFYYPSVLMDCTWYYPSLNSLYNQIFMKMKIVGRSVSLLNDPNALVTKSTLSLRVLRLRKSQVTNHGRLQEYTREVLTPIYFILP